MSQAIRLAEAARQRVTIYALADPRIRDPIRRFRYVGASMDLRKRLYAHIAAGRRRSKDPCSAWIWSLLRRGLRPTIHHLETVALNVAVNIERSWIVRLRSAGARLMNSRREKPYGGWQLRLTHLGRRLSRAHRRKIRASQKRGWRENYAEYYALRCAHLAGRHHPVSESTRRKMSLSARHRKRKASLATRRRMSVSIRAALRDPAVRAKMSSAAKCNNTIDRLRRRRYARKN